MKSDSKQKVFLGLSDIAGFIDDWDYGFKMNGYDTLKASFEYQSPYQNSKLDFVIKKYQDKIGYFKPGTISSRLKPWWDNRVKEYFFSKALRDCDIFVFFWNSFNIDRSDLEIIKKENKKVITVFVGDDIRWQPAMLQEFTLSKLPIIEYENYDYSVQGLGNKISYLRKAEHFSDVILGQRNSAQLALRSYKNLLIPIVAEKYPCSPLKNEIPIVVHAPTSVGKGTQYVEAAIERLKNEKVNFIYKKVQNLPLNEALKVYETSDIIIDQLLTPGGGKLAHEGLAMGKVVLTLVERATYDQKKPEEIPFVDVRAETIYEKLKEVLLSKELREDIASKGRPYILKYHDPKKIIGEVIKRLNNEITDDFHPEFFRDKFIPESKESIEVYNKWTAYVKNCDWYKRTVKSGERSGLNF